MKCAGPVSKFGERGLGCIHLGDKSLTEFCDMLKGKYVRMDRAMMIKVFRASALDPIHL